MADLKRDLDEYLSRNNEKTQLNQSSLSLSFSLPELGKWVKPTAPQEETSNGWFQDVQEDCCPKMTRMQRMVGFCLCIFMGMFCFTLAALYTPVLLLKARRFSLLFTLGSLFFMCSFSFMWGVTNHLRHLFSRERITFTISYLGSLFGTLYFAMVAKSTPFTVLCAVGQIIALLFFLVNSFPGGKLGFSFFKKLFSSTVKSQVGKTLPV